MQPSEHFIKVIDVLDGKRLYFFFKTNNFQFPITDPTTNTARLSPRYEGKSNPTTGLERPRGFQEDEAPRFQDNRHMKVVRLSALRTGRLYPPGNIPGTHFCQRLGRPQGHNAAGRIMSMKKIQRIEPATFRLVAQCLNQLRYRVPHDTKVRKH